DGMMDKEHHNGYDEGYDEGFAVASKKVSVDVYETMNKISKSNFLELYPDSVMAKELNDEEDEDEHEADEDEQEETAPLQGFFDGIEKYWKDG
ncbi:unnamed protein product, partial [marine sediment metagenome]